LPLPAAIKPEIVLIATEVSKTMLECFGQPAGISGLLGAMTSPTNFPF
jgi:hypothetical protein